MRLATGAAGIKYRNRTDVLLALFDKGTTIAGVLTRALPLLSLARHHSTGAEGHFERVSTPATVVPLSNSASRTSVRLRYLIPAAPVASRTPAISGMSGTCLGARGEMVEDIARQIARLPAQIRKCPAQRPGIDVTLHRGLRRSNSTSSARPAERRVRAPPEPQAHRFARPCLRREVW